MTLSEIHRIHLMTILCVIASLVCYALCIFLFNDYLHVSTFTMGDFFYVCLITGASFGPLLIAKVLRRVILPTDYEKVMKHVKKRVIATKILGETEDKLRKSTGPLEEELL